MEVGERFLCMARDRPSRYGNPQVGAVSNRAYNLHSIWLRLALLKPVPVHLCWGNDSAGLGR